VVDSDLAPAEAPDRAITLTWTHFDPGQGLTIQVVYAGNEAARFDVAAQIVGITEVQRATALGAGKWMIVAWLTAASLGALWSVRELLRLKDPVSLMIRDKDFAGHFTEQDIRRALEGKDLTFLHRLMKGVQYIFLVLAIAAACFSGWLLIQNQSPPFLMLCR